MKKQLFYSLLCCMLALPAMNIQADVVDEGQSTEGKDFWVTFMQADQGSNSLILQLSISAREDCEVVIRNPFTQYNETVNVVANEMKLVEVYRGSSPMANTVRNDMTTTGKICYSVFSEQIDTCALHVVANKNISLFATNYKYATFDATNVLPTPSLRDEYIVQTYTPSDHDGASKSQGSHFAIIAAEDNTVVDYVPTVYTKQYAEVFEKAAQGYYLDEKDSALLDYKVGIDTLHSPVLKKGQVWYVWTGKKDGAIGDFSGTYVKARDGKKIAVFQGCPHTNIPYQVKQRDHIFSQAMPIQYWGNTFVLTSSKNRAADIIRILALNDETTVYVNGDSVYTFDFANNPKHFWEFSIGAQGSYGKDSSCVVTTSCPAAVHLFIASQVYQDSKNKNGDPSMIWINPIEQQIDQVTFATYQSLGQSGTGTDRTTYHYVNIVTDRPDLMKLDGSSIAGDFKPVSGSTKYYYAQKSLGSDARSHTLKSDSSNFIAHVYGFTQNESYGYSAGGATVPLTQYITINGQIFTPESENTLCGEDTIKFACVPDYVYTKIAWNFGDGSPIREIPYEDREKDSIVPHYYTASGSYPAYVLIYRESSNVCVGQNAVDSIPITVTIGRYQFAITEIEIPCPEDGKTPIGKVFYTNEGHVNLHGDNVTIEFDAVAKADGFKDSDLEITDKYFQITIPATAKPETEYGIHLVIVSDCGGADTTMHFMLNYDKDVIIQRYDNVLGLLASTFEGKELSDYQWYRTSDSTAIEGQVSANLNFYDIPYGGDINDTYYVCFTINKGTADEVKTCACAKAFNTDATQHEFVNDPDKLLITATYMNVGDVVFVNANWGGKTDVKCYAQWINASGRIYADKTFDIPDGGCTIETPKENGLYLLRVVTGKATRSFKFFINK